MSLAHDPDQLFDLDPTELSKGCSRCAALAKLAYFDQLTGLANRFTFKAKLDRALERAEQEGSQFAVLFVDLDNFKTVNDSLGHDAGDLLLQQVAARLQWTVRENDLVARYGGDEFAVLLEDTSVRPSSIADRLSKALGDAPFVLNNENVFITASIGIALYPIDARTCSGLLRTADGAMYVRKGDRALLKVGS